MIGERPQDKRYLDTSNLTEDQQKKLKILIAEAKARGLNVPVDAIDKSFTVFPIDDNGYFVKNDGRHYKATDSHAGFIASNARFVLFYGSRGAGKSASGAQKALKRISMGLDGTVINPKFEDFKTSTWEEFRRWIPPETVVPKHRYRLNPEWEAMRPFTLTFMNGAKVYCKGLKDPDSARGANVNWLWYDEGGSDLDGKGWRIAIAAVRVGWKPQAWVTSTPNGVLHWMHDFFMDEEKIKNLASEPEFAEVDRKFVEVFKGTMEQNKTNLDPTFYVSMKTAYSGWEKAQEIEGDFVSQGGTLGDASWFNQRRLQEVPEDATVQKRIRYWDLAASEKKVGTDPDKTVGSLMSWLKWEYNKEFLESWIDYPIGKDCFVIENQVSGYWQWLDIKEKIFQVALQDGYFTKIRIEQEPGSGGKNQIAELQNFIHRRCGEMGIPPFDVKGHRPEGDKVMRANIWFAEARQGQVWIRNGSWNKAFLKTLDGFPMLKHDDEVDSVSGARWTIAPVRSWSKIDFIHI